MIPALKVPKTPENSGSKIEYKIRNRLSTLGEMGRGDKVLPPREEAAEGLGSPQQA